ncbi:FtsX-like permease family protein [bacterium]|nr:FtsX-like permease family protein [bacterium]
MPAAIEEIEKAWASVAAKFPFEYKFLDQSYDSLYRNEIKQRSLLSVFSILAVCIACLGLFGLASFSAEKRTKEIGVRKVLGASVPQLVGLFTKEFVLLVLTANVVAIPVAYYAVRQWLQEFAYRIDIGIDMFLIAALAALAIAVLTVSYQAFRTATANPVEALKYE